MYVNLQTCKIVKAVKAVLLRIENSRKAQTVIRCILIAALMTVLLLASVMPTMAQVTMQNPLEWAALDFGNTEINKAVAKNIKKENITIGMMGATDSKLLIVKGWEKKYIQYLETVDGFASSLEAGSMIFADGVKCLLNIKKLAQAVADNPEGLLSTAGMNNIYIETFAEFSGVYTMMEKAIKQGGADNLLDGRARCQLLWALEDKISALNKKLARLVINVGTYNLTDLWYSRAGYVTYRHDRSWVKQNLSQWRRTAQSVHKYKPLY